MRIRTLLTPLAISLLATAALAQDAVTGYRTRLLTAAFTPADGPYAGDGSATAEVAGRRIRIQGSVTGLGSPVSRVQLRTGAEVGVPGEAVVAELPVTAAGAFSGEIPASAANAALLRGQRLYVQVNTEAAPEGALWGWLMPNHPFPGQNKPEKSNPYAR